jgi:hypothetical protein
VCEQRFPWAAQIIADSALTKEEPQKLALLLTGQQVSLYGPEVPLPTRYGGRAKATVSHLALQAVTILVFARISLYKCFPRFLPETVAEVCGEHSGNEQLVQRALSALRTDLLAVPLAAATKQAVLARFPAHEPESLHL